MMNHLRSWKSRSVFSCGQWCHNQMEWADMRFEYDKDEIIWKSGWNAIVKLNGSEQFITCTQFKYSYFDLFWLHHIQISCNTSFSLEVPYDLRSYVMTSSWLLISYWILFESNFEIEFKHNRYIRIEFIVWF